MGEAPAFRMFGFPIHVRSGFLLFLLMVVFVNQDRQLGLWIAGSATVLTLLHELGHAFAARATGARAEISLDFFAGYASFLPTRPLKRWERAGISLAGPAVQVAVSVAALTAIGVDPLDRDSIGRSDAGIAIWWTGPIMGLFNLIPVLPLDGGNIAHAALDRVLPGRAYRPMLWFSICATVLAGAWLYSDPVRRPLAFIAVFPLLLQLQMVFAPKQLTFGAVSAGETRAWQHGDTSSIPDGMAPSPWYRAHQQLVAGHPDRARDVLLTDFMETDGPNWSPPDAAQPAQLDPLVRLLPEPLPHGHPYSDHTLATVLLRLGQFERAATYAAESFTRYPNTMIAVVVARSAAALDDADIAMGWLEAAYRADTNVRGLQHSLSAADEFAALRSADPRFAAFETRVKASLVP